MNAIEEIITIIEEGRSESLPSGRIAEMIFSNAFIDHSLAVEENGTERPVNITELIAIARKAIEQACFDGGIVLLPSGKIIKRKESAYTQDH